MRNADGDIDIGEYLRRLPDQGKCLTTPGSLLHIHPDYTYQSYLDPGLPRITGLGPIECSSCTTVAITPEVIWDTNRYYRQLGFTFPYKGMSKKDLRLAFVERDGPNNERLMYIFTQLIDPTIRRRYDRTPLGEIFLDRYVQEALKRDILREATSRPGVKREEDGSVTQEEIDKILKERGLVAEPEPEYGETGDSAEYTSHPTAPVPWRWSYYTWRATSSDTDNLGRWQTLLISAFAQLRLRRTFAVGYLGKQPHPYVKSDVDGRTVYFLNEETEPTEELAARAAEETYVEMYRTRRIHEQRSLLP